MKEVLKKNVFEGKDIEENKEKEKIEGKGKLKYEEKKKGEYYRMVKNEEYWGEGEKYMDEVI